MSVENSELPPDDNVLSPEVKRIFQLLGGELPLERAVKLAGEIT